MVMPLYFIYLTLTIFFSFKDMFNKKVGFLDLMKLAVVSCISSLEREMPLIPEICSCLSTDNLKRQIKRQLFSGCNISDKLSILST